MAQQGRNDNTYGFDELAFWRPIDAENRHIYRAVLRESRAIQDEAQDILNRFAGLSMMGLLPKRRWNGCTGISPAGKSRERAPASCGC